MFCKAFVALFLAWTITADASLHGRNQADHVTWDRSRRLLALPRGTNVSTPLPTSYSLETSYEGQSFFEGFNFIANWDNTTHGYTNYVSEVNATTRKLAYVNNRGQAVIKVDNTTDINPALMPAVSQNLTDGKFTVNYTALRDSVRLESKKYVTMDSLIIGDFEHAPFGCATWPSFWMYGDNWPNNGEVDILEGYNLHTQNWATLHTTANCSHDPSATQLGTTLQETCDYSINYNEGCTVQSNSTRSFGSAFNAQGGGAFAALFTKEVISVWRWDRDDIPSDVQHSQPKPSSWGIPEATWLNTDCDIAEKFGPQKITFTTTMCGDADRNTYAKSGCPGTCNEQFVNGSNYDEAYWQVNYVRVFKVNS